MKPPKLDIQTRKFSDPLQPDEEPIELTLKPLNMVEFMEANSRHLRLRELYANGENLMVLPDGTQLMLSEELCQLVHTLEAMQVVDNPDDRYTPQEFISMAFKMPNAFAEIAQWATSIRGDVEGN